jgi:hypothetical protein
MVDKSVWAILAGMVGVGAIAGSTLAFIQQQQVAQRPTASVTAAPASTSVSPPASVATARPPVSPIAPAPDTRAPSAPSVPPAASVRSVTKCRVVMAIVKDDTPLNVRAQPNTATGKVLTTLKDGTFVSVKQEAEGWFEILNPPGWIAKNKTVSRCGEKVEQVELATGTIAIADEFIGTGNHQYQLQLTQGQTLSVQGEIGPLPGLIAPNGKYLIGMDETQGQWSQEIATTGTYTLQMDSNFRGYKYDFTIAIK